MAKKKVWFSPPKCKMKREQKVGELDKLTMVGVGVGVGVGACEQTEAARARTKAKRILGSIVVGTRRERERR